MVNYPARSVTVSVGVGGPIGSGACPAATTANTVSDNKAYYDNNTTPGVITQVGNLTQTTVLDGYSGATPQYVTTTSANSFDAYGRSTGTTDTRGLITSTSYTPATGQLPTTVTVKRHRRLHHHHDGRPGTRAAHQSGRRQQQRHVHSL